MKQLFTFALLLAITLLPAQSLFQKAYAPTNGSYNPVSLVQTSDGGYMVGTSSGIVKLDATGQPQWSKWVNLPAMISVQECSGGGYYVFGTWTDTAGTGLSLVRLDASGNLLWAKMYPGTENSYNYSKVRQTSDGGFIISESAYSRMGAIRTDANGNVLWSCTYASDTTINAKNPSFDCQLLSDGSMIFTGKRETDICLLKTDANGQVQWTQVLNDGVSYYHANSVTPLSSGGFAIVGYDDMQAFAMKTDANGNINWYENFIGSNSFEQVQERSNGDLVMTGIGSTGYDVNIVVINNSGAVLDSRTFDTQYPVYQTNAYMCATSDGGFALASGYMDYSNSVFMLTMLKTNSAATINCAYIADSVSVDPNTQVPVQVNVPVYRLARSITPVSFVPSVTSDAVTEVDFCQFLGIENPAPATMSVTAYPSPLSSGEALQLEVKGYAGNAAVEIYDATGKRVRQMARTLSGNDVLELGTMNFGNGIYFVRISDENRQTLATTKFIVK